MNNQRMAGSEPVLPLLLAAAGAMPGLSAQQQEMARQRLGRLDPALLAVVLDQGIVR